MFLFSQSDKPFVIIFIDVGYLNFTSDGPMVLTFGAFGNDFIYTTWPLLTLFNHSILSLKPINCSLSKFLQVNSGTFTSRAMDDGFVFEFCICSFHIYLVIGISTQMPLTHACLTVLVFGFKGFHDFGFIFLWQFGHPGLSALK